MVIRIENAEQAGRDGAQSAVSSKPSDEIVGEWMKGMPGSNGQGDAQSGVTLARAFVELGVGGVPYEPATPVCETSALRRHPYPHYEVVIVPCPRPVPYEYGQRYYGPPTVAPGGVGLEFGIGNNKR